MHQREVVDIPMIERRRRTFYDALVNGVVNVKKNASRAELLRQRPELRRRVDLEACRRVIDFKDFRVSPRCSIARDQAIEGSDLDGGVVVVTETVSENQEYAFIEELRKQGFAACHVSERDHLRSEY